MKATALKLGFSVLLLVASLPAVWISGWFALGVPVGLALSILYWFDLGRELRISSFNHRALRLTGLIMGIPQALFGLLCAVVGMAIAGWVLYNSLWQRDPHYTGGFMTFGVAPSLVVFGVAMILDACRRSPSDGN